MKYLIEYLSIAIGRNIIKKKKNPRFEYENLNSLKFYNKEPIN